MVKKLKTKNNTPTSQKNQEKVFFRKEENK